MIAALIAISGIAFVCLMSSNVQTATARLLLNSLSKNLETKMEVGNIEITFPANLSIQDIYIEDQQQDTLLYIARLNARFHPKALLKHDKIHFSRIEIDSTYINTYSLSDSTYNFSFLFPNDTTEEDSSQTFLNTIATDKVQITNTRFRYDDYVSTIPQLSFRMPYMSSDSLNACISGTHAAISRHDTTLIIQDFQAHVLANRTSLALPTLSLQLPQSDLNLSGIHWTEDEIFFHILQASITPNDLTLLVPTIGNLSGVVGLTADISGSQDSLSATNLSLSYDGKRIILGDVYLKRMSENDSLFVRADCLDFSLCARQVQDFVSELTNRPYRLPESLHRLGDVHYQGRLQGNRDDVTLHGAFRTALGSITTDGHLTQDTAQHNLYFDGRVTTNRFQLGRFVGDKDLETVSMTITGNGYSHDKQFPEGEAQIDIRQVTYRQYTYRDIRLAGTFAKDLYDGMLVIDDPNLQLRFNGLADFSESAAVLNADIVIPHFAPGPLHLSDRYADTEVRMTSNINLNGLDFNHLNGYFIIDSLYIRNGTDSVLVEQVKIVAEAEENTSARCDKNIKLTSDFLTAGASGTYDYNTLLVSCAKQLMRYLPNAFPSALQKSIRSTSSNNVVNFYIYGHEMKALQRVINLPVRVSDNPVIKGYINEPQNSIGLKMFIPYLRSRTNRTDNLIIAIDNNLSDYLTLGVSTTYNDISCDLRAVAQADSICLHILADDPLPPTNSCDIRLTTHCHQYAGKPLLSTHIYPSSFLLTDSTYAISDSHIDYCMADTSLLVKDFRLSTGRQFIEANGIASTHPTDSLRIRLQEIQASYLIPFFLPERTLTVQGNLSGWANLYGLFSSPMFEADVKLDSAGLNGAYIGDAVAKVALDKNNNHILIQGDVTEANHHVAHVDGLVEPDEHAWEINILPDSFSLAFINHWTNGFLRDISGRCYGQVKVFGRGPNTWVNSAAYAKDAGLTVPFTGCRYTFSDSAYLDSFAIRFPHIDLRDEEGHPVHLNATLTHRNFLNFQYDVSISPERALVFNQADLSGDLMSGKVYASGDVTIQGNDDLCRLTANATTVGQSRFRLSIDGPGNAHESSFIHFVDHNTISVETPTKDEDFGDDIIYKRRVARPGSRFILSMNIDATPELNFEMMLNERTGDMIRARGEGGLQLIYDDQTDDVSLFGTYSLLRGDLGFTIANIIHRDFSIMEGSQIIWSGIADKPTLDVTATYHVTASLKDLFGDEINTLTTSRTTIPLNTLISLSGPFDNPIIKFGLDMPMSEDIIKQQVMSVINTDEMLMRQVAYLLVFGKFFTPDYMRSTDFARTGAVYSLLSSTITGQINSWIGKLTNSFTMGFDIRSDEAGNNGTTEYEAQLQWQPIDRLLINGNVGYRYNDITNRPFFGDVDIEYMITPNGKLRVKGYTHTVDKYSIRQASTIQGIGFVFKHDFNWTKPKKRLSPTQNSPSTTQTPKQP